MKNKKRIIIVSLGVFVFFPLLTGVAGWQYHEQPQFCASCHLMQTYLDSWTGDRVGEVNGEPLLANTHSLEEVECLDCHDQSIDESFNELMVFVKDEYRDPLKQREFEQEWCFRCHDHTSREEIIARTEDYTYEYEIAEEFRDVLGEQGIELIGNEMLINPHSFPVDIDNMDDPHGDDNALPDCYECHAMHRESPGLEYCFTCHHSRILVACSTCHEGEPGADSVKSD